MPIASSNVHIQRVHLSPEAIIESLLGSFPLDPDMGGKADSSSGILNDIPLSKIAPLARSLNAATDSRIVEYLRRQRHQLTQEVVALSPVGVWQHYWNEMRSAADRVMAEALCHEYVRLIHEMEAIERIYSMSSLADANEYFDKLSADSKKIAKIRKPVPKPLALGIDMQPERFNNLMAGIASVVLNVGFAPNAVMTDMLDVVQSPKPEAVSPLERLYPPQHILANYRGEAESRRIIKVGHDYLAARHSSSAKRTILSMSDNILSHELEIVGKEKNALQGIAAKSRVLLLDSNIPVPNAVTAPAWFERVGIYWAELRPSAQLRLFQQWGRNLTHAACYLVPAMPATAEHRNMGGLQDQSTHADHSLPMRSAGHARRLSGAIDYGCWLAVRAYIGGPDTEAVVRVMPLTSIDLNNAQIVQQLFAVSPVDPFDRKSMTIGAYAGFGAEDILASFDDPFLAFGKGVAVADPSRIASLGIRAFAKKKLHFRFDSQESAGIWAGEMATSLSQWIHSTDRERMNQQQLRMVDLASGSTAKMSSRVKTKYDLSGLRA